MNVALPALIVFLLLLPGFIARSRFKRAERASLDFSPFGQIVTEAVLWSCVFHLLWLIASGVLFGRALQPAVLLKILSADPASQSRAVDAIATQFFWICAYFLSLYAGALIAPTGFRMLITRFRLDRFNAGWFAPLFRFHQAPWYYLLTGADFDEDNQPDFISVSAIVNVAGQAVLFIGILDDFFVDADGGLDRLILQQVMRRPLLADQPYDPADDDPTRFYGVEGDYFVLRYSEAITLNIEYIKLAKVETDEAVDEPSDGAQAIDAAAEIAG